MVAPNAALTLVTTVENNDIVPATRTRESSRMIARLQVRTHADHAAIVSRLFGPLDHPTVPAYRHFLACVYGFDAPLGNRLLSTAGLPSDVVIPRLRTSQIAHDLLALDLTESERRLLREPHAIGPLASGAEALGWLFAWERLTLEHARIRHRLGEAIPDALTRAGLYLASTVDAPSRSWRQLGRLLDHSAYTEIIAERMCRGAEACLASLHAWLATSSAF